MDLNDLDGSMADFNKALELNPNDQYAYNNRGCLKNKKQEYKLAIADFDEAIRLNASYGYAYFNRGIAKENLRDLTGACKDWSEAVLNGIAEAKQYKETDCN
jgi:tetratricopeptide (TPR) repeat protein